jgi:hypothetical protein
VQEAESSKLEEWRLRAGTEVGDKWILYVERFKEECASFRLIGNCPNDFRTESWLQAERRVKSFSILLDE